MKCPHCHIELNRCIKTLTYTEYVPYKRYNIQIKDSYILVKNKKTGKMLFFSSYENKKDINTILLKHQFVRKRKKKEKYCKFCHAHI